MFLCIETQPNSNHHAPIQPGGSFEIKHVLLDGDMAAIHVLAHAKPGDHGTAVVDLYRLAGGKVVEHWDVLQPVPAKSANPHPMF